MSELVSRELLRQPESWTEKKAELIRLSASILEVNGTNRSNDEYIIRDVEWNDDTRNQRFEISEAATRCEEGSSGITIRCIDQLSGKSMSFLIGTTKGEDFVYRESEYGEYENIEMAEEGDWVTDAYDYLLAAWNDALREQVLSDYSPRQFEEIVVNTAVDFIDGMCRDGAKNPHESLTHYWRQVGNNAVKELGVQTIVGLATKGAKNPYTRPMLGWRLHPDAVAEAAHHRIYAPEPEQGC